MAASWKAATGKKDAAPSAPRPHCARDVLVFAAGVAAAVLAFLGLSSFVLVPGWRGGGGFAAFPVPGPADGPRTFYDDPDLSYALDCRITGWDAKRAAWLWSRGLGAGAAGSEGRRGRPLVTCSFLKNKLDYCRLHGTELLYDNVLLEPSMATYWAKIPAVRAAILAHPDAEGVC
ncbi:probable glycosyltransferase 6 [Setaria italica]|uniref:probable glycosyltransferase 6 n=1 Tax=Setaria italica TaxID=4555 RepID=UPI000350FA05|nr:probable glycosyltransferase 6 [Setaria italica]